MKLLTPFIRRSLQTATAAGLLALAWPLGAADGDQALLDKV